jgi:predicted phage replisome organizer
MADVKWIKIVTDIFDDEKIQLIEALPSADTIIVIWFKMLCLAGKCNNNGVLMLNDRIPYTDEMLAAIFRRKVTDIRMALQIFEQYGMIEIIENAYAIPNWSKHQSLDYYEKKKEYDREYRRIKRAEQKALIEDSQSNPENPEKSRTTVVRQSDDSSTSLSIYVFTNHSNTNNYVYLIDNSIYKDSEYIKENERLHEIIKEWMEYKDERTPKKNNAYTERGMKSLLTEIIEWHKQYGDEPVISTIRHTISNQWQGIVWDWMEKKYSKVLANENAGYDDSDFPFK